MTVYNDKWQEEFPFIRQGHSVYYAKCEDCGSEFSIKNGSRSDIKQHCKTKKHTLCPKASVDESLVNEANNASVDSLVNETDENNNDLNLSPQEDVMKAEILQALKIVNSNYSFNSSCADSERFREMFHDSVIAKNYHQSKTKVYYSINPLW